MKMSSQLVAAQERLLRLPEVRRTTGLSRSGLYASPLGAQRVKLGKRAVAWPESTVQRFVAERIAASAKAV